MEKVSSVATGSYSLSNCGNTIGVSGNTFGVFEISFGVLHFSVSKKQFSHRNICFIDGKVVLLQ
jgi:hypothetical protein